MAAKTATGKRKQKRVTGRERVTAYRRRMRSMGYRPVELWVPDTRNPHFISSLRRQCRLVATRERTDRSLEAWLDTNAREAFAEIDRNEEEAGAPLPSWGPESPV